MLRTRSSQRVERANRMLKGKVSAQISLNELFLRLINLHQDMSNHDITLQEKEQMLKAHDLIPNSPILEEIENKVSCYAYQFTVLNIGHALSWKVLNKPIYFKVYQESEEDALKVHKINNLLVCSCYFYSSMKIPCQHILACLICSSDTESHRSLMKNLILMFHQRWHVTLEDEDHEMKTLNDFIRNYQVDKDLKPNKLLEGHEQLLKVNEKDQIRKDEEEEKEDYKSEFSEDKRRNEEIDLNWNNRDEEFIRLVEKRKEVIKDQTSIMKTNDKKIKTYISPI